MLGDDWGSFGDDDQGNLRGDLSKCFQPLSLIIWYVCDNARRGFLTAVKCERNGDFARDLKGFVEKKGRDGTRKSTSAESGRSGSASGSSAASGRMWKGKSRG